jgi:hypothetical protein
MSGRKVERQLQQLREWGKRERNRDGEKRRGNDGEEERSG